MISIIISSCNEQLYQEIEKNISESIGINYELIKIENNKKFSLCEAYNIGADKAIYDILLFIHEDVVFHTHSWGKLLINAFSENFNLGLLGLAGLKVKSFLPSGWYLNMQEYKVLNYIQSINKKDRVTYEVNLDRDLSVVCIDGFFMATTKKVFNVIRFDNALLKDFHGYDLDYSLAVKNKGFDIQILTDISVEHQSVGLLSEKWFDEIIKINRKWEKFLPVYTDSFLSNNDKKNIEFKAIKEMLFFKKQNRYKSDAMKYYLQSRVLIEKIGFINYIKVLGFTKLFVRNH